MGCAGSLIFTVAHELLHSPAKVDKALASLGLMPLAYMHWVPSHIAHHCNVRSLLPSAVCLLGFHLCHSTRRTANTHLCVTWGMEASLHTCRKSFAMRHSMEGSLWEALCSERVSVLGLGQVGLHEDPTTARLGEPLYRYIPRSVLGNIRDGVRMEAQRLRARRLPLLSLHNRCCCAAPQHRTGDPPLAVLHEVRCSLLAGCCGGLAAPSVC